MQQHKLWYFGDMVKNLLIIAKLSYAIKYMVNAKIP